MFPDSVLVVKCLFTTIWSLFTSWKIPGTNVTPAMWAIFCLLFVFVLKFVIPFILGGTSLFVGGSHDDGGSPPHDTWTSGF